MGTPQPLSDPAAPFRYVGGDPSIDFVNTVDWTDRGLEGDRFTRYDRLIEWAEGAGVLTPGVLTVLRRRARRDRASAQRVVRQAIELRALLERILRRTAEGRRADAEVAALNKGWLRRSLAELAVVRDGGAGGAGDASRVLAWPRAGDALESPLWVVAWSAARLLTSTDAARIRRCGGIDCGWYYVDRSRNGLRRWCQMETCGTLMKSRRRAERRARGATAASASASRTPE